VSWEKFRELALRFAQLSSEQRENFLWRGQGDSKWKLQATLDREIEFKNDADRAAFAHGLSDAYYRELMYLAVDRQMPNTEASELLGRHHGLPSPLLDFTRSPWFAAYFAFRDMPKDAERATVWRLDRAKIHEFGERDVELIDDDDLLRFNHRALMQRGMFLRVNSVQRPIERTLASALVLYDVEAADRPLALADLDAMGINATRLYADAQGAAMTVWDRMIEGLQGSL
jgi:hypothetical protein